MLYYSLVYSRVQYGIILWGSTFKSILRELEVRLNNRPIVRTITGNWKFDHVTPLFKQLKLLKLHDDIYQLELGKFMYQLNWNKLPNIIQSLLKLKICTNIIRDKQKQSNYSYQEYLNKWRKLNYRLEGHNIGH